MSKKLERKLREKTETKCHKTPIIIRTPEDLHAKIKGLSQSLSRKKGQQISINTLGIIAFEMLLEANK